MTAEEIEILSKKLHIGIDLYFQQLLEKRIKEDGEFVISRDGEIVRIKARDLKR